MTYFDISLQCGSNHLAQLVSNVDYVMIKNEFKVDIQNATGPTENRWSIKKSIVHEPFHLTKNISSASVQLEVQFQADKNSISLLAPKKAFITRRSILDNIFATFATSNFK